MNVNDLTRTTTSAPTGTPAPHPEPDPVGLRQATPSDLMGDLLRLGPAPTRSRELFVAVVTLAVLAVALFLLGSSPVAIGVAIGICTLFIAVRWTIGTRKWAQR